MKLILKNKSVLMIVAAVIIIFVYYFFVYKPKQQAGTNPGGGIKAYNDADEAAYQQILAWVAAHDSFEYRWWSGDLPLYFPGGERSAVGQFGLHPDMPDGSISKTQRIMVAMNELHLNKQAGTDCTVTDVDAYNFTRALYNNLKLSLV